MAAQNGGGRRFLSGADSLRDGSPARRGPRVVPVPPRRQGRPVPAPAGCPAAADRAPPLGPSLLPGPPPPWKERGPVSVQRGLGGTCVLPADVRAAGTAASLRPPPPNPSRVRPVHVEESRAPAAALSSVSQAEGLLRRHPLRRDQKRSRAFAAEPSPGSPGREARQ